MTEGETNTVSGENAVQHHVLTLCGPWFTAIQQAAALRGVELSRDELERQVRWLSPDKKLAEALAQAGRGTGLKIELVQNSLQSVPELLLPVLALCQDGSVAVVLRRSTDTVVVSFPDRAGTLEHELPLATFEETLSGTLAFLEPLATKARDARLDEFLKQPSKKWIQNILLKDKRSYYEVIAASVFGNTLAFCVSLFAMQVWDRVVPAQSIPTLWVLTIGVVLALMLEFLMRMSRVVVMDHVGKKADLEISARLFARALDIKNHARPRSTGSFIAQVRDIEQVRELMSSTTIAALIDVPFILLFLALFAYLAGPLVFILLVALILIALPGFLLQKPLGALAQEGIKEAAIRNAILIETVERIEEIKSLQAEARFQSLWEKMTLKSAQVSIGQRFLSALFTNWMQTLQQLSYTAVVVGGAFMVMDGDMTMGALIACSILTSRALSLFMPMGQVFTRYQNAKVSFGSLSELFSKPVDHDPSKALIRRSTMRGHYTLSNVQYAYNEDGPIVLQIPNLEIRPGERIALLGRVGAGKSTLLRLLSGLSEPSSGQILIDGTNLAQINPSDTRREVSYLSQHSALFLGSIRENITLGKPGVSDMEIMKVLSLTGGASLVQKQSMGLDLMLQEGGIGLSGGQRQALLLARSLLHDGNVILLDEPSAPMDETSERLFVRNLKEWLGSRTLIITTNRSGILDLVDRIIVVDQGQVVLDGPKADVIARLSQNQGTNAQKARTTQPAPNKTGASHQAPPPAGNTPSTQPTGTVTVTRAPTTAVTIRKSTDSTPGAKSDQD